MIGEPGCELLSFFVPLGWFTARPVISKRLAGCELLSFFVPLGWFTAKIIKNLKIFLLWIAFVLCTFGLIYSVIRINHTTVTVVNCFRSLYLWVDLQQHGHSCDNQDRCELLSFFVPLGWFTAEPPRRYFPIHVVNCFRSLYLWVDLQLQSNEPALSRVVNCFRSLYLWVDLQQRTGSVTGYGSCELLSFFVPLGWFTAGFFPRAYGYQLWIAFVLCTFGLIYSITLYSVRICAVVNCFRSLYLWVDLQPFQHSTSDVLSCELLSFFVPLGWFTASCHIAIEVGSCELLSFFVPLGWFTA